MSTPNMSLSLPVVGTTLGPAYASLNNAAFQVIDAHNHAPGSGSQIGTAGIRLDADLAFNSYNLTGARTLRLTDQTSITLAATDIRALYAKSGNLFYVNASGTEVQITNGSSVNAATGSITGLASPASAVFSSGTSAFTFFKDSNLFAYLGVSDLSLYEFGNASAAAVTIKSPASLANAYSLTLPSALPASTRYLTLTSAGVIGFDSVAPTGSGAVVLASSPTIASATLSTPTISSPTISTPTITGTPTFSSFTNTPVLSVGPGSTLVAASTTGTGNVVFSSAPTFAGVPGGTITSGTYSPGITNLSGATMTAAQAFQYMRIGNTVTVWGTVTTSSANTGALSSFTVPFAPTSNFSGINAVAGVASSNNSGDINKVRSSSGAKTVTYTWTAASSTTLEGNLSFTYNCA